MKLVNKNAYRALTETLKSARKQAGLTQQEIADRLKRPQSFVTKYESGERRLDVLEFVTIADAIGSNPSRLFARILREIRSVDQCS
jgi:transcriptional regulator with XRE-family HTH domain